jgi:hypothetical protein
MYNQVPDMHLHCLVSYLNTKIRLMVEPVVFLAINLLLGLTAGYVFTMALIVSSYHIG